MLEKDLLPKFQKSVKRFISNSTHSVDSVGGDSAEGDSAGQFHLQNFPPIFPPIFPKVSSKFRSQFRSQFRSFGFRRSIGFLLIFVVWGTLFSGASLAEELRLSEAENGNAEMETADAVELESDEITQADSNSEKEKLPAGIQILEILDVYELIRQKISARGEFETRVEYRNRIEDFFKSLPSSEIGPNRYCYMRIENVDFVYLIDRNLGSFKGGIVKKLNPSTYESESGGNDFLLVLHSDYEKSSYEAGNAFGARRSVTHYRGKSWGLFFQDPSSDIVFAAKHQDEWWKKMDVSEAREIKNKCAAVVRFQFAPELLPDGYSPLVKSSSHLEPTFDDPFEFDLGYFGIPAKDLTILFFNEETKEIVFEIEFDSYKNEWTKEIEVKKERNEKRRAKQYERTEYFFMDWKTPQGMIYAKFIKMSGGNVVLEDEKGKRIEVPLEEMDERYQDLCDLARCFNRVKKALQKPRTWTNRVQVKHKGRKRVPVTYHGSFRMMTDQVIVIEDDETHEFYRVPLKEISEKDFKWIHRIYKEFTEKLQRYEETYQVHLLPPLNLEPETID